MAKKTGLIGYCGLYCGDCPGYTHTVANLARGLRKELRRYRFSDMAKMLATIPFLREFTHYEKCYEVLGAMSKLRCRKTCRKRRRSVNCKVPNCCRDKNIQGCWQCDRFATCEKLKFLEGHHGVAHLKNLRKLKRYGPAAFVIGKRYWYAAK